METVKCYQKGYMRPQFVRKDWICLDGQWDFLFDDENEGERLCFFERFPENCFKINVPYSYETPASGINDQTMHPVMWYRRMLDIAPPEDGRRIIVNFEGADYLTKVWCNGRLAGTHEGGYCRFSIDITDYLVCGKESELIVRCEDSYDTAQPRGKQRWLKDSFGCWYVQTSGIWKSVWCETVSATRLSGVKITPLIDTQSARFEYELTGKLENTEVETVIEYQGNMIARNRITVKTSVFGNEVDVKSGAFDFKVKLWYLKDPNLYDVTYIVYKDGKEVDRVGSYFGMRKIEADEKGIRLNNSPLYQKLVLCQNYWAETGYTMPDEEAAIRDLQIALDAGFNGIRIHQKIEDERFLYYCDVMGVIAWGEFPAAYEFNDKAIKLFTKEWEEALAQQYNHPSIVTWVPFNESWGLPGVYTERAQQSFTEGIYHLTKAFDPYRPVVTNDGWEHTCSDILTLHDYDGCPASMRARYGDGMQGILSNKVAHGQYKFAFAKGHSYAGQPIIISEYGGIAFEDGQGWGYNDKVKDAGIYLDRLEKLTEVIKKIPNVSGYCYTQLTDVYQEENGIAGADRCLKVGSEQINKINNK